MPLVSNRLAKVQKHIAKKKGRNASLHENSRDTRRLQSASARDGKLNRLAAGREKQNKPYCNTCQRLSGELTDVNVCAVLRVKTFQSYTVEHEAPCAIPEIQGLIEDYLGRDDEELAKLKTERRSGRPPSNRETLLKQNQEAEQGEYASGFWVPDLEDMENLKKLKDWNGQWANLNILKFIRITKAGTRKESSFPPKGMS